MVPYFYNYIAGWSTKFAGIQVSALGQMFLDKAATASSRCLTTQGGAARCRLSHTERRHMTRYVLRRLALSIVTLFLVVTIVFLHQQRLPERRRAAGSRAVPVPGAASTRSNEKLGTNDPLIDQYGGW